MIVRNVAGKTERRFRTFENASLGITGYGADNLYPETLRAAVLGSATGMECVERYAAFIEGAGFAAQGAGDTVVNVRGDTLDDIHALVCQDLALFNGFALHVQYNAFCEVAAVSPLPFAACRLCIPDDWGYVARIAVHPDWSGHLRRNGRQVAVARRTIDYYNVFNPDKEIVAREMAAAGGAAHYGGQVLWVSAAGAATYPVSRCDRVFTELLTDAGLANVKYRNACCNFLPSGMIVTRRGASSAAVTADDTHEAARAAAAFSSALTKLQGDVNTGKLLEATIESDEERPEFVRLESTNYDKAFEVTDSSVTERIYSAFGQEPWYCIRIGKVGFSGDILADAFDYYNTIVERQRRLVARAFSRVFAAWNGTFPADLAVSPLRYIKSAGL